MSKKILYFFIVTSSLFSGINFSINGDFSNFYALRTSDNSILNIPFKLSNINSTLYFDNFEIHHNYSIEYRKINSDNLISSENFMELIILIWVKSVSENKFLLLEV